MRRRVPGGTRLTRPDSTAHPRDCGDVLCTASDGLAVAGRRLPTPIEVGT